MNIQTVKLSQLWLWITEALELIHQKSIMWCLCIIGFIFSAVIPLTILNLVLNILEIDFRNTPAPLIEIFFCFVFIIAMLLLTLGIIKCVHLQRLNGSFSLINMFPSLVTLKLILDIALFLMPLYLFFLMNMHKVVVNFWLYDWVSNIFLALFFLIIFIMIAALVRFRQDSALNTLKYAMTGLIRNIKLFLIIAILSILSFECIEQLHLFALGYFYSDLTLLLLVEQGKSLVPYVVLTISECIFQIAIMVWITITCYLASQHIYFQKEIKTDLPVIF